MVKPKHRTFQKVFISTCMSPVHLGTIVWHRYDCKYPLSKQINKWNNFLIEASNGYCRSCNQLIVYQWNITVCSVPGLNGLFVYYLILDFSFEFERINTFIMAQCVIALSNQSTWTQLICEINSPIHLGYQNKNERKREVIEQTVTIQVLCLMIPCSYWICVICMQNAMKLFRFRNYKPILIYGAVII